MRKRRRTPPRLGLLPLALLALVVGLITGIGAVVFRGLIGLIHNLLFLGKLSFVYNASLFTPADPLGPFIILVPVIGGLGVTWIVSNFAPEAKGHGVPEVMDAVYYNRGVIRPVVAVVKSIASALAIGSGAAVGREGPIIQIGSALGSTLGQVIRMPTGQRITLVAAGAGAGIAATFNTPIGGVLFATELMLPEVSVDTFLPVAVATGTATFIGRMFFGSQPAFSVPVDLAALPNAPSGVATLVLYALLGAIVGVAAAGFVRTLHWLEDGFDLIGGRYLRHALGMLIIGVAMYAFWLSERALFHRRRGLRDDPGDLARRVHECRLPAAAGRRQAARNFDQPGVRLVRRRVLALALHGRDPGCGLRLAGHIAVPRRAREPAGFRHGRHGRDGRRRDRCGDDRGDDDLRDDARL